MLAECIGPYQINKKLFYVSKLHVYTILIFVYMMIKSKVKDLKVFKSSI